MLVTIAHGQVSRTVGAAAGDSDSATPAQGTRAESFVYGADVGIGESDNVTLVADGQGQSDDGDSGSRL